MPSNEIVSTDEQVQHTCTACSSTSESNEGFLETVDGQVCPDCSSDYQECDGCADTYLRTDMTYAECDDEYYCRDCTTDLDHCGNCDAYAADLNMRDIVCEDGTVSTCQNCRSGMDTFRCDCCNRTYDANHFDYDEVTGYGSMCTSCQEQRNVVCCDGCDRLYEGRRLQSDGEGSSYCEDCRRSKDGSYIHNYSYKPKTKFCMSEAEKASGKSPDLFFGLELEVENVGGRISHSGMTKKIQKKDVLYFKSDGSINDGFEIVSHPLSYEFIKEQKESIFLPMLNTLIEGKFRSYDTSTCGMHIHMSKKAFGTWQLYRFIKFFIDNKTFVTAISQRKTESINRWAAIESEPDSSIIYKAKKKSGNDRRYVAINLQNEHTVEIRIFRGTLNIHSFMKNLEFCYALFNFTRDINDTSIDAFKKYINQSNEYAVLKKFIKTKNL